MIVKIMKYFLFFVALAVAFGCGYLLQFLPKKYLVYELTKPLEIETERSNQERKKYFLPPGTVLYFEPTSGDAEFEGFRIYLNMFGPPLPLKETEKRGLITSLSSNPDGVNGPLLEPRKGTVAGEDKGTLPDSIRKRTIN